MIKQHGIITLYIIAAIALFTVACAKQDTITIPEQREPVRLPEIEEEDIYGGDDLPETDTAQAAEVEEEDLLDGGEQ